MPDDKLEQLVNEMIVAGKPLAEIQAFADNYQEPPPTTGDRVMGAFRTANTPLVDLRGNPRVRAATDAFEQEHPVLGKVANTAADAVSSLSSPTSLALGALSMGAVPAAEAAGLPRVAAALRMPGRAASAGMMAHGGYNTATGLAEGDYPKALGGVAEAGLGSGEFDLPRQAIRGVGGMMEGAGKYGRWPLRMVGAHQVLSGNPAGIATLAAPEALQYIGGKITKFGGGATLQEVAELKHAAKAERDAQGILAGERAVKDKAQAQAEREMRGDIAKETRRLDQEGKARTQRLSVADAQTRQALLGDLTDRRAQQRADVAADAASEADARQQVTTRQNQEKQLSTRFTTSLTDKNTRLDAEATAQQLAEQEAQSRQRIEDTIREQGLEKQTPRIQRGTTEKGGSRLSMVEPYGKPEAPVHPDPKVAELMNAGYDQAVAERMAAKGGPIQPAIRFQGKPVTVPAAMQETPVTHVPADTPPLRTSKSGRGTVDVPGYGTFSDNDLETLIAKHPQVVKKILAKQPLTTQEALEASQTLQEQAGARQGYYRTGGEANYTRKTQDPKE